MLLGTCLDKHSTSREKQLTLLSQLKEKHARCLLVVLCHTPCVVQNNIYNGVILSVSSPQTHNMSQLVTTLLRVFTLAVINTSTNISLIPTLLVGSRSMKNVKFSIICY